MKKIKVLSLVLALCMALSAFTIAATADENEETVTIKKGQQVKYSVSLQMEQKFGAIDGRFFYDIDKFGLLCETKEDNVIIDPDTGEKLYSDEHKYYSLCFPGVNLNEGTKTGTNDPEIEGVAGAQVVANFFDDNMNGEFDDNMNGEVYWNYIATSGAADVEMVGFDYSEGVELMVAVVEAKEDITCTKEDLNDFLRFDYAEMLNVNWEEIDFFDDANGTIDIEILDETVSEDASEN